MSAGEVTVVVLNLEDGGWDRQHEDHRNLDLLPELIGHVPAVDVVLFQEGKHYGLRGQELRYRAETLLGRFGLRSFMTPSTIGQLHDLVFVRWPRFRPVTHYKAGLPDVFHDQIGWLHFQVEGLDRPLAVRSLQWPHWDGGARLDAAQKLTRFAAPGRLSLLGGDFNALWPDCRRPRQWWRPWPRRVHREFEPNWERLPPRKRTHKTLPPGLRPHGRLVSDRRAMQVLKEVGFVNAGCVAGDMTVTVNTNIDHGQGGRIDHILFSPDLAPAQVAGSYRVWISELGTRLTNHRMVSVRLNLDQVAP
ncbi:endonuclease/exonuclease/phosphatase family protein [Actinomadura sp. SCN-SB]|uniref:endonuclease/exonuclease/phosphatase family protein n=1 Tax=Actinomadura sp. SCN-SB TaxID=3373092 RepID=UPI0037522D18